MKRFWSLIIAVVMLFTVFAFVSCEKNTPTSEPTTVATTVEPTTAAPTTAAPTTAAPTTAEPTTAAPTTAAPTTAEPTTAQPTTAEPTTAEPTTAEPTETTKAPAATTGTTIPLYARFDFGTKSYAVEQGLTAHQYLVDGLTYSDSYLYIDYKEDSWKIWVMSDYDDSAAVSAYALRFESLITYDYDFPDEGLFPGWGTWAKYPYTTANVGVASQWKGRHQYMKIRLINNTSNNMIGIWWSASNSPGFFTTLRCSNLYLQGSVGSKTCSATTSYATYTYDIAFTNALASNRFGWGSGQVTKPDGTQTGQEAWCNTATFADFITAAKDSRNLGLIGANNWCSAAAEAGGIYFFLFGAADTGDSGNANCDSRSNAKQGSFVEVDYILFGSSLEQLDAYKSNLERAAANA